VVVLTTLLFSCDPPGNIGVTPLTPVETLFTDTLTVRMSTVLADSVRTSNPDVFLAGRYVDPLFGTITASSFIRMSLGFQLDLGTTAVYDSLVLYTPYNYTYGDTLPAQTLAVHRIREVIDPLKTYYNNSTLLYDAAPLATRTFQARPQTSGALSFKLPDDLGKELFALSGQTAGQTNAEFSKILGGLAIIPDAKNTAVLGFPGMIGSTGNTGITSPLSLRLWYHTTTDTTSKSFPLNAVVATQSGGTVRAGFNGVTADRTGTPLGTLKPLQPVPASNTGGRTFVQDALGVRTKIEIPYFKSLAQNGPIAINRAELSIKPDLTAVQAGLSPPSYLLLIETNSTNRVQYATNGLAAIVLNDVGTGVSDPPSVLFDSRFKNYTWRLATHLNAVLSGSTKNESFLLTPVYTTALGQGGTRYDSQLNSRVSRLVLSAKPEDTKLILFYTQAKE
jgi:hypothetical protein